MKIDFSAGGNIVALEKELSKLDEFVIHFSKVLEENHVDYVIVSGYVALAFGRSRGTEDIDVIIQKIDEAGFERLWNSLTSSGGFECLNAFTPSEAFRLLTVGTALRFFSTNQFIPNAEMKFAKTSLDDYALKRKLRLVLNNHNLFISPLELQVCFKLFLGSEKDVEDARFLYKLFEKKLDAREIMRFANALKVSSKLKFLR